MDVVSLLVGFHKLLVFLYMSLPILMCLYVPLRTRRRHDMNIYGTIILRCVVRKLRKSGVYICGPSVPSYRGKYKFNLFFSFYNFKIVKIRCL